VSRLLGFILVLALGAAVLPQVARVVVAGTGDSPPVTSFTHTGTVGFVLDVEPNDGTSVFGGTFTISGIPAGASIQRALYYTQSWNSATSNATLNFNGNNLGSVAPHASDPGGGLVLDSYRVDVTSAVTGNGSYTFQVSATNVYYAALLVVYSHPSEPSRTLKINDGSENLTIGPSTTTFAGMLAGPGTLTIVTQADDAFGTGESLQFNGSTLLGPGDVFNSNLGAVASRHDVAVAVQAGANTATVTTGGDHFGWHLAILTGPGPQLTATPTPTATATGTPAPSPTPRPRVNVGGAAGAIAAAASNSAQQNQDAAARQQPTAVAPAVPATSIRPPSTGDAGLR
jgi:hypothetical protein